MNKLFLSFVAMAATVAFPIAAHASTLPASKYMYSTVLPPGAIYARAADGNPMNSGGNVGGSANFGQTCGDGGAFVYFRTSRRTSCLIIHQRSEPPVRTSPVFRTTTV